MLQVLFLLVLFYSLFALSRTRGPIFINSTLDAAPGDELDAPSPPVCVNNTQHQIWGLALQQFDYSTCRNSLGLMTSRLDGNIYTSYDFFSRRVYPSGTFPPGDEGWPLAQGAGSGSSKAVSRRLRRDRMSSLMVRTGNCAVVIRMTRDFASQALPISGDRFAPTSQAKAVQRSSWLFLVRSLEYLLSVCVRDNGLPGWAMDTKNIVVAFWPRTSVMNEKYGIRMASAQADSNSSWLILSSE